MIVDDENDNPTHHLELNYYLTRSSKLTSLWRRRHFYQQIRIRSKSKISLNHKKTPSRKLHFETRIFNNRLLIYTLAVFISMKY
jgi:hypothetical protein